MGKKIKWILIILAILFIAIMILRGSEDRWMCQDGEWVKHGVPSAPMPDEACE